METNATHAGAEARDAPVGKARVLGGLLALLGLVAIVAAFAATLATVLLFGILLIFGGMMQIVQTSQTSGEDKAWELLSGVLYLIVGALIVFDPVDGAIGLTLLLSILFFAVGAMRLWLAARARRTEGPAGILAATGVLDLLLGVLILAGWPATGTWVIGLFVGIELLVSGLALLIAPRRSWPARLVAEA